MILAIAEQLKSAKEINSIFSPLIQLGFAGFSVLLLGIIVWLVKRLLELLNQTNGIIAANTQAIREVAAATRTELGLIRDLRDKLLTRPCMKE